LLKDIEIDVWRPIVSPSTFDLRIRRKLLFVFEETLARYGQTKHPMAKIEGAPRFV